MDRITPKEVLSMMDAVAQVYEQPEKDQVDERKTKFCQCSINNVLIKLFL